MNDIDMSKYFSQSPWEAEAEADVPMVTSEVDTPFIEMDEKEFVDYLYKEALITDIQKLAILKNWREDQQLLQMIEEYAHLSAERIAESISKFLRADYVDSIYDYTLSKDIYDIDVQQAIAGKILPIEDSNHDLLYMMVNPFDEHLIKLLGAWSTGKNFALAICTPITFSKFLDHNNATIQERLTGIAAVKSNDEIELLLRRIISEAIKQRASDIRIFLFDQIGRVTFRIDGDLVVYGEYDLDTINRLNDMIANSPNTEVTETNDEVPRTGSMRLSFDNSEYELRCSFIKTINGHDTNIRFVYSENIDIMKLGLSPSRLHIFQHLADYDNGLIYFTGPTGSGKSTSLYSVLEMVKNLYTICTVEDPVEHKMPGLVQVSLNTQISYIDSIKAFLRHDPDIIVVGETRVSEVAEHVITCANTGHLTFSTLHTNSALSAIARLRDLKVSNIDIADNMKHIISQILVKRACPMCSESTELNKDELLELLDNPLLAQYLKKDQYEILRGNPERQMGCKHCEGRGTYGRFLATEVLTLDDEVRESILQNSSIYEIRSYATNKQLLTREEELCYNLTEKILRLDEAKLLLGRTVLNG